MINWLHAFFHSVENGFDPVSEDYTREYSTMVWTLGAQEDVLNHLEKWVGSFKETRVLDLGGGPGQYSVAFARRGADVTWYDISRAYQKIAEEKAREHGVKIRFSLGYLDRASEILNDTYDLVFNRGCWFYCWNDATFAKVVVSLVRPGGIGYIDTHPSTWSKAPHSPSLHIKTWVNDHTGVKIGHPFPRRGRLACLIGGLDVEKLSIDYSSPDNDRLLFVRARKRQ